MSASVMPCMGFPGCEGHSQVLFSILWCTNLIALTESLVTRQSLSFSKCGIA